MNEFKRRVPKKIPPSLEPTKGKYWTADERLAGSRCVHEMLYSSPLMIIYTSFLYNETWKEKTRYYMYFD